MWSLEWGTVAHIILFTLRTLQWGHHYSHVIDKAERGRFKVSLNSRQSHPDLPATGTSPLSSSAQCLFPLAFTVVINETEGQGWVWPWPWHRASPTDHKGTRLPAVACFVQDTLKQAMILGFKHLEGGAAGWGEGIYFSGLRKRSLSYGIFLELGTALYPISLHCLPQVQGTASSTPAPSGA